MLGVMWTLWTLWTPRISKRRKLYHEIPNKFRLFYSARETSRSQKDLRRMTTPPLGPSPSTPHRPCRSRAKNAFIFSFWLYRRRVGRRLPPLTVQGMPTRSGAAAPVYILEYIQHKYVKCLWSITTILNIYSR
jgi:hypothetical protein